MADQLWHKSASFATVFVEGHHAIFERQRRGAIWQMHTVLSALAAPDGQSAAFLYVQQALTRSREGRAC